MDIMNVGAASSNVKSVSSPADFGEIDDHGNQLCDWGSTGGLYFGTGSPLEVGMPGIDIPIYGVIDRFSVVS